MLSTKRAVIFDCDGTLIHSLEDVYFCINQALARINCAPLPKETIRKLVGPDLVKTIGYEVAESHFNFDEFIKHYVEIYKSKAVLNTTVFPGVEETLMRLKNDNFVLSVYSNKPASQSTPILQNLQIAHYFDDIIGPDTFGVAKPDPEGILYVQRKYDFESKQTLFVGDTLTDIHTANNASVDCVSVSYGYQSREELSKHNDFHVINNILEIFTL
jgi:phosphoglycolate phosphatase